MNWYKKAQKNNNKWRWDIFLKSFGAGSILGLALWMGISTFDLKESYIKNPQFIEQKAIEYKKDISEHSVDQKESEVVKNNSVNIDLDKIWEIESSRGKNLWNEATKARGHFQFLKNTWEECTKRMGVNWDWENGSMNYEKSRLVADFYLNKRIPQMLNYFKIPDTIETRLAAYNWGIGNLKKSIEEHQNEWLIYAPTETHNYINKYGI